jgi:hypothetical protein
LIANGRRGGFFFASLIQYFMADLQKWLHIIKDLQLLPNIMGANFSSLWLQTFDGNITILPPSPSVDQLLRLLHDPDMPRYAKMLENGQRYTWPKIKMIENQSKIELCLSKWLDKLKNKSTTN